jgi:hypothetical protein
MRPDFRARVSHEAVQSQFETGSQKVGRVVNAIDAVNHRDEASGGEAPKQLIARRIITVGGKSASADSSEAVPLVRVRIGFEGKDLTPRTGAGTKRVSASEAAGLHMHRDPLRAEPHQDRLLALCGRLAGRLQYINRFEREGPLEGYIDGVKAGIKTFHAGMLWITPV